MRSSKQFTSILLSLLMILLPLAATSPSFLQEEIESEQYSDSFSGPTSGWGESAAGSEFTDGGADWEMTSTRGVDDWMEYFVSNDTIDHFDVAIGPDGTAKACGHNSANGSLEFFTISPDGEVTRETIDGPFPGNQGLYGQQCSIIIDYRGLARIAYLSGPPGNSLHIARENDFTPLAGDDWLKRTLVDDVSILDQPQIAMYSNGSIAIAYKEAYGDIHLVQFFGSWWHHRVLAGTADSGADFVLNIDADDVLHLSYYDWATHRLGVISLDGEQRSYSVVDEGVGIGQPLGHHLDSSSRAQLVYGVEDGTGLRIVRDLTGRDSGRISPDPVLNLQSSQSTDFGTNANADADYNQDGFSDLTYGEPGFANDTGAVHIHYGSMSGYASSSNVTLLGPHEGARFGASLAVVGNSTGTGYDNLLVGAPLATNASGDSTGAVHLYSGSALGLISNPTWVGTSDTIDSHFGSRVDHAGDINGDGYSDMLVTELGWSNADNDKGRVHVIEGGNTIQGISTTITGGTPNVILGYAIAGIGDVNGDGFDDIAIGSSDDATAVSGRGQAQIHLGSANGISDVANTTWSRIDQWTLFGHSISALGDANNDGYADIAVSEIGRSEGAVIWIYHGSASGFSNQADYSMTSSNGWGLNIQPAGDINDDGRVDFLIGDLQGRTEILQGQHSGDFVDRNADHLFLQVSNANSGFGKILSAGGDSDRDGVHEFIYASTESGSGTGGIGGSVIVMETRDWELTDIPITQMLGITSEIITAGWHIEGIDLSVDAQGRTHLLLDEYGNSFYHLERPNELQTSADPWGVTHLAGSYRDAAMAVNPAGQPIFAADGVNSAQTAPIVNFIRPEGGTFVETDSLFPVGDHYGSIAIPSSGHSAIAHSSTVSSGTQHVVYTNQTGLQAGNTYASGFESDIVASGAYIEQSIELLFDSTSTPHIVWRDSDLDEIHLAIQNGSTWDQSILATEANGSQFGAIMAENDSIVLMYRHNTSGLVTEWHNGTGEDWSSSSMTVISNATDETGRAIFRQNADGNLEILFEDNQSIWQHRFNDDGTVSTGFNLQESSDQSGRAHFTSNGILIPTEEEVGDWNGFYVVADDSGQSNSVREIRISCSDPDLVVIVADSHSTFERTADSTTSERYICSTSNGIVTDYLEPGHHTISRNPIQLMGTSTSGNYPTTQFPMDVVVEDNGTWHLLFSVPASNSGDLFIQRRLIDTDRDFIPNHIDELPNLGGQWDDGDGDGFGDNPNGPSADKCPSIEGYSEYGHHGCGDIDGDGFANSIDDCANSGKSWRDTIGCPDTDGDGWSDPSGEPGWDGDRHPTNWMQAIDTDGDGRYDNHGPDCCGQNAESDEFPLDPQQWVDADGDGWGDNSSAPTGDKCPGFEGHSIYDRGGCLDSDGDGWSDPEPPTSSRPYGWTYNATRCYNSWVDDEGNTRAAGEHCADLYPWGEDDTSAENICGDRCDEQWGDRDGDGYGDNNSQGAWNRDAFPLDPTQYEDTDEDGYGDNPDGNNADDCPNIWGNSTVDKKGCTDSDGDGHSNLYTYDVNSETGLRENEQGDALPDNPQQWRDQDGDGFGENPFGDWDRCPEVAGALLGVPGPGCPMPVGDEDGDNIADEDDLCPDSPEGESVNSDGCAPSQLDTDQDTVTDDIDICPNTPLGEVVNEVGCSMSQTDIDSDGDGVNDVDENADLLDLCPNTDSADYDDVDENGCAPSQRDTDGDGITDDLDLCPDTTSGATVTSDGCIVVGADTDNDGFEDAVDDFPSEPTQWQDSDGDGFGDNWADGSWNATREGTVGQWFANATNPDYCPEESGTSDNSAWAGTGAGVILGCADSDGDGWADSIDWDQEESTQWVDADDDGFGDNRSGTMGDQCIGQPGIADVDGDGPHENGCPAPDEDNDGVFNNLDQCQGTITNSTVNSEGCAAYQLDTDDDGVSDDVDQCPGTPADDWNIVNRDTGCTPAQLEDDDGSSMGGMMQYVGIGLGVIFGLLLIMLVIRRIRGGQIDWDDDDDDFYDDDDDEDDWSPFGGVSTSASPAPTRSFSTPQSSTPQQPPRGPPSRAPMGANSRGPTTQSRGPPMRSQSTAPPSSSRPSGPSRTTRRPGAGMRPSSPAKPTVAEPEKPVRKTRRTAGTGTSTQPAVRKTRKTSTGSVSDAAPRARKTRRSTTEPKQSRRRRSSTSFDDLFGADEKSDYDAAVAAAKERLIVGDSEQSVLARLQSEGWNVKQSKFILDQSKP